MSRATRRALTVLLAIAGGCDEWPRFANLPPSDAVDADAPDALVLSASLEEPAAPGWPDTPDALPAATQSNLGAIWEVTRIEGTLAPFGGSSSGDAAKAPHACAGADSPVAYTAGTDVDWVHLWSDGGPLCLLLDIDPRATQADAVVYAFDPDAGCVTGSFLNPPAENDPALPGVIEQGGPMFLADVPLGPLAVYVAGVASDGLAAEEVPYALNVVSATVAESCLALTPSDVDSLEEAP